ncbi:MAG: transketolase [Proteobacteria bacterium]|nr:transketolase [Pseudomonadota bacterium]
MTRPSDEGVALTAKTVRVLTVDAVRQAGIGHVGLPLGCAELGVTLFGELLKYDPADPDWPDRDRFVLSAGHGSMLLYSLLHLSGYALPMQQIERFRQLHSATPGHPEHGETPGVETTTGPLGQGVANAVGMALAERVLAARFGSELVDHRTYALASDGDLMEGVASEAASLAAHLGLGRLIVLYDDNAVTIDGPAELAFSEDVGRRFEAYGWDVCSIDGHDPGALQAAVRAAWESEERPHLICCRTHIGQGSPEVDTSPAHGAIPDDSVEATRRALAWELPPFRVPEAARDYFRPAAERGARERAAWMRRKDQALKDPGLADLWASMLERELPDLAELLPDFAGAGAMATRQASGKLLNAFAPEVPGLVGGSADLAGSNNTRLAGEADVQRGKFEGRNLHFGVREHAMGAIANGLALHGGLRPYTGTFLVFSDYMRPAIRLAALMRQPVIYVFTHDSIFVGEDGPTHQPVEQVAALRAIPNLEVWRPGDAAEAAAAWQAALRRDSGPTALILTRQAVPPIRADGIAAGAERGGYVVHSESGGPAELVIAATGSEVSISLEAARALEDQGRRVRVVSLPCLERFRDQDSDYRERVLPTGVRRLVVEAGVELGIATLLQPGDRFHGMSGFGASAPWKDLAQEFGFTGERVAGIARELLGS